MAKLKETYVNDIAPALFKKFGYKSVMQIPKLDKVVVNVGCGEARDNHKIIDAIMTDLATITGQKAVPCDRNPSSPRQKSPLRTSNFVKAWLSALK